MLLPAFDQQPAQPPCDLDELDSSGIMHHGKRLREHCEAAHCGARDSSAPAWNVCRAEQSVTVTLVQLWALKLLSPAACLATGGPGNARAS
jgi:hypothetical protein